MPVARQELALVNNGASEAVVAISRHGRLLHTTCMSHISENTTTKHELIKVVL